MTKKSIFLILLVVSIFLSSCINQVENKEQPQGASLEELEEIMNEDTHWQDIDLADITTGQTFTVRDFRGKIVLLESFAVWCPTCTKQQSKVHQLKEMVGDSIVSISLNTDPNENVDTIKNHIELNKFNGLYAISPRTMTQSLINEFGISVVNAPSAPIIIICEDGASRLLGRGLKQVEELQQEIVRGC